MKAMTKKLLYLLAAVGVAAILWYGFGLKDMVSLEIVQAHTLYFQRMVAHHYLAAVLIFIALYTALISAAIPASPPLTLLGSVLFGFLPGFCYSFTSCVLGATISFIVIRYVIKKWMRGHHTQRVEQFNEQFKKYGASYLLMLHFLSIIPYVIITLLASLAEVPLTTFIWTLAIGSLPLLLLYSWTGRELASVSSIQDIFSAKVLIILGVLILLALLPILFRRFKKAWGL